MMTKSDADLTDQKWMLWLSAVMGSFIVGLIGVMPPLFVSFKEKGPEQKILNRCLGFAIGTILADVFFHLLPELYVKKDGIDTGVSIIAGVLFFVILEKVIDDSRPDDKKAIGYLNAAANCIDNFVHSLAVASSFLTSFKLGFLSLVATLLHEIPHEIGDFTILLSSGFTRQEAIKCQLITAFTGVLGAVFALATDVVTINSTKWILGFSTGGFLSIALVSMMPDLQKEPNNKELMIQLACTAFGVFVMAAATNFN